MEASPARRGYVKEARNAEARAVLGEQFCSPSKTVFNIISKKCGPPPLAYLSLRPSPYTSLPASSCPSSLPGEALLNTLPVRPSVVSPLASGSPSPAGLLSRDSGDE